MSPKEKALYMLGRLPKQEDKPFSDKGSAISCCNELIHVFEQYHPPQNMVANYWMEVRKKLLELNN